MRIAASLSLIPIVLGIVTQVADARPKVAVLGLEVAGATVTAEATTVADELTVALRQRVKAVRGGLILGPGTEVTLGAAKVEAKCKDTNRACLSAIGASYNVDQLLVGELEAVADGYRITLRRFHVPTSRFLVVLGDTIPTAELEGRKLHETAKALYAKITKP